MEFFKINTLTLIRLNKVLRLRYCCRLDFKVPVLGGFIWGIEIWSFLLNTSVPVESWNSLEVGTKWVVSRQTGMHNITQLDLQPSKLKLIFNFTCLFPVTRFTLFWWWLIFHRRYVLAIPTPFHRKCNLHQAPVSYIFNIIWSPLLLLWWLPTTGKGAFFYL